MSFGGTGLRDWLVQRASATYLGLYVVLLTIFFLRHPNLSYDEWQSLFSNVGVRIATVMALAFIGLHAWIGLNIVAGDYIKRACIRAGFLGLVFVALVAYLIWGIIILWS